MIDVYVAEYTEYGPIDGTMGVVLKDKMFKNGEIDLQYLTDFINKWVAKEEYWTDTPSKVKSLRLEDWFILKPESDSLFLKLEWKNSGRTYTIRLKPFTLEL